MTGTRPLRVVQWATGNIGTRALRADCVLCMQQWCNVDDICRLLAAGTVGAQRITVSGMRNDRPLLRIRLNWYCTTDIDASWDLRETGWRVLVEGAAVARDVK